MAAAIEQEWGIRPELVGGSGGIFDVMLDHVVVYGKEEGGCGVPDDETVLSALREFGL